MKNFPLSHGYRGNTKYKQLPLQKRKNTEIAVREIKDVAKQLCIGCIITLSHSTFLKIIIYVQKQAQLIIVSLNFNMSFGLSLKTF